MTVSWWIKKLMKPCVYVHLLHDILLYSMIICFLCCPSSLFIRKTSICCKCNLTWILPRRVNDQRYFCKTLSYWSKIYRIVSWRYGVTYLVIWNIFQRNPLNINVKDNLLYCHTEYLLMKKSISAWYWHMILRFAFSFILSFVFVLFFCDFFSYQLFCVLRLLFAFLNV